jgi:hypothetical protein
MPVVQAAPVVPEPRRFAHEDKNGPGRTNLTKRARTAFIRRAQVWKATDVPRMNLRLGPGGPGAFAPGQVVDCDYTDVHMGGETPKFHCRLPNGDVVKVRYGTNNGEVEGSVLATRLLWALGFVADRVYPVRIRCRGCTPDPWHDRGHSSATREFDPAVIERKAPGHVLREDDKKAGWAWPELDLIDESAGGAPRAHRDALKLLAVLMQHSDTKPQQQRLICLSGTPVVDTDCQQPFMMLHDVGVTFGRANSRNRDSIGSVNFEEWAKTPIWKDPGACVSQLSKSNTGTLGDPRIGEAGRRFLADLLVQLSDQQLRDLFEVARVDRRQPSKNTASGPRVEDWIAAFKQKRTDIVDHRCPS